MLPLNKKLDIQSSTNQSLPDSNTDPKGTLKGRRITKSIDISVWRRVAEIGMYLIPLMLVPICLQKHVCLQKHEIAKINEPIVPSIPKIQPIGYSDRNLSIFLPNPKLLLPSPEVNAVEIVEIKDEIITEKIAPVIILCLWGLVMYTSLKIFNRDPIFPDHTPIEEQKIRPHYPIAPLVKPKLNVQVINEDDQAKKLNTIPSVIKSEFAKKPIETDTGLKKIHHDISAIEHIFAEIIHSNNSVLKLNTYRQLSNSEEIFCLALECIEKLKTCSEVYESTYNQLISNAFSWLVKHDEVHACKLAIHCIGKKDSTAKDIINKSFKQSMLSPPLFASTCMQEIQNDHNFPPNILHLLLKISQEHAFAFAMACIEKGFYQFITRTTFKEFQSESLDLAFSFGIGCIGINDYNCISNVEQASSVFQQIDLKNGFVTNYTLRFAMECARKNADNALTESYNFLRDKNFADALALIDWCRETPENPTCVRMVHFHHTLYDKNHSQPLALI